MPGTPRQSASGAFPAEPSETSGEAIPLAYQYSEGDVIAGKYRLRHLIGRGGMGDVWRAHNETLDIDVAIKLLRAEADGGSAEDRLLREARAAARLGHPAIVRVFDFGATEFGEPFIVMERLEGEDLATSLAHHGRLSATKAVRTLLPIAHALEAAHAKRIIHRDLKPENIFLTRTDEDRLQPKIVDFGIAKIDRGKNVKLTQKGTVIGSPGYMSPEQARGDEIDQRADIWSFCVVLYEALTGMQPFVGKNDNALLYAIVAHEPAPITSLAAGDVALSAILEKGFAKNPDKRWQSMHDLGVALATWLAAQGVSEDIAGASLEATWLSDSGPRDVLGTLPPNDVAFARPRVATTERPAPPPRRLTGRLIAVALIAVVFIGGIVGFVHRSRTRATQSVRPLSAAPPSVPTALATPSTFPVAETAIEEHSAAPEPDVAAPSAAEPGAAAPLVGSAAYSTSTSARKGHAKAVAPSSVPAKLSKPASGRNPPTLKDPFQ